MAENDGRIITRERMVPIREHWRCPVVNCAGEMVATGEGFTTNVTRWMHRCSVCRHKEDATNVQFPRIIYEPAMSSDAVGQRSE